MRVPDRETITRRLESLVAQPRETLEIELKEWLDVGGDKLHDADLGQACLALANHGGGFVVIGFQEGGSRWVPAPDRPSDLDKYNADYINGIIKKYADPPFHCEVHFVADPATGEKYPVVVVPGGHQVPVRAKSADPERRHIKEHAYYIRRPGPESAPPRSAAEWHTLIRRCVLAARDDLLEGIRAAVMPPTSDLSAAGGEAETELDGWFQQSIERWRLQADTLPAGSPGRCEHGYWALGYALSSDAVALQLPELSRLLAQISSRVSGWAPWYPSLPAPLDPHAYDNALECWTGTFNDIPFLAEYWRASPQGLAFILRGYQEDRLLAPGTQFSLPLPMIDLGECLMHAHRLADALGDPDAAVDVRVMWTGLDGRQLMTWPNLGLLVASRVSHQNESGAKLHVDRASSIPDALTDLVMTLTQSLYWLFDLFEPDRTLFEKELKAIRLDR